MSLISSSVADVIVIIGDSNAYALSTLQYICLFCNIHEFQISKTFLKAKVYATVLFLVVFNKF